MLGQRKRIRKKRCVRAQKERKDQLPASGKYLRTRSVRFHHWGRLPLPQVHLWERKRDQLPAKGKYLRTQSLRLHHRGRLPLPQCFGLVALPRLPLLPILQLNRRRNRLLCLSGVAVTVTVSTGSNRLRVP
ncbi:hypothetical protein Taro_031976 [Colocasia esculenta]|uniref:Uncharacterized protein n=1 Tax=Colocasia esculenta TaxID=4460 RepID=A0A843VW24_COLES|nr:hypothetical protein [Colocasia esculenta]